MDHVNEDMDELFRKAGELYPLKTTNSDWDTVIGKLGSADEAGQSGLSGGDRKNHRWRWLLLLIPAALGGALYTVHLHNTSLALASANTKHHPQSVIVQQEKSSQGDPSAKSIANKDSRAGGGAKEIFAKTGNDVDQALASHATSAPAYSNQGKAADFSTQAINIKGENLSAANGLVKVQAIRLGKAYNQEMPGTANGESPIRQQTNSPKAVLAAAGQAGGFRGGYRRDDVRAGFHTDGVRRGGCGS